MGKYDSLAGWLERRRDPTIQLSLTKIEAVLGSGLPRSAKVHKPYWGRGNPIGNMLHRIGWRASLDPGTQVVVFSRARTSVSRALPALDSSSNDPGSRAHVILLGCVKKKRSSAAPAKDIYASPLWNARRMYAEAARTDWMILSAKYGLLEPDKVIEPYDASLSELSRSEQRAWSDQVFQQLIALFGEIGEITFEIHAGRPYSEAGLSDALRAAGAVVVRPLEGLALGQQLAWYSEQSETSPTASTTASDGGSAAPSREKARASKIATLAVSAFYGGDLDLQKRPGAPVAGWASMPECRAAAAIRTSTKRGPGFPWSLMPAVDREVRLFLTFMAAMDRARDADKLWDAGIELFRRQSWVFEPEDVTRSSLTRLRGALVSSGVSRRHTQDVSAWRIIAESLHSHRVGAVNRVIEEGRGEAAAILEGVEARARSGQPYFPLLRGPKVSRMWVRMLANPGSAAVEHIEIVPVAVDVQVRRISNFLGVADTRGMTLERATPVVQKAWLEAAADAKFGGPERIADTCAALDPALWFHAKWGCTYCERVGKKQPVGSACEYCQMGM